MYRMPRKLKVVDLETNEVKTINETTTEEPVVQPVVETASEDNHDVPDSEAEPVVVKKKRAPRPKKQRDAKAILEPVKEEELVKVEEPIKSDPEPVKVEEPVKSDPVPVKTEEKANIRTQELVECPDCHKKLTQRTLKYSHQSVCPAKNIPEPKQKKTKQQDDIIVADNRVVEETQIQPMHRPVRIAAPRSERYKHLVMNAF